MTLAVMMKYHIVDAFTDQPFGGNPAGVVLLEGDTFPPEALMLQVAAELRYSETAFVRRLSPTDFHLRYFIKKPLYDIPEESATGTAFILCARLGRINCIFAASKLNLN